MRIAILHEMLVKLGGAEKVVEELCHIFPDADLYTLMYDEKKVGGVFPKTKIHPQVFSLTTQKIYSLFKNQRFCLPLMPRSVESLDFSKYDVVIASSSGFAHGAITKPETRFIVYYHAPARYLWDWTHEYRTDIGWKKGIKGYLLGKLFLRLRIWDYIASKRSDIHLANSKNTQARIQKYFRTESQILYPPVDTERFSKDIQVPLSPYLKGKGLEDGGKYYIILSALTEFKRIDIAIAAFNAMQIPLLIIGEGNKRSELERISHKNIHFVGAQYGDTLVSLVQESLGLIFPGEEDFGIVPIEVMAAGKPVFALGKGGLRETVIPGKTGNFFFEADGSDFIEHFTPFHEKNQAGGFHPKDCQKQAEKFSAKTFAETMKKLVAGDI